MRWGLYLVPIVASLREDPPIKGGDKAVVLTAADVYAAENCNLIHAVGKFGKVQCDEAPPSTDVSIPDDADWVVKSWSGNISKEELNSLYTPPHCQADSGANCNALQVAVDEIDCWQRESINIYMRHF